MVQRMIIAIGALRNPLDLQVGCFGTLSKLIKQGCKASLVIVREGSQKFNKRNKKLEGLIEESAEPLGISNVYITDRFDYSYVSQDNVNVLKSFIELSGASTAIIPLITTNDAKQRVLAESSLLACRSISNLFMYRFIKTNQEFTPHLFSRIPKDCLLLKQLCIDILVKYYYKDATESIIKEYLEKESSLMSSVHGFRKDSKYFEEFAIHRSILLSSNQILE